MNKLRLVLLATTAFGVAPIAATTAFATSGPTVTTAVTLASGGASLDGHGQHADAAMQFAQGGPPEGEPKGEPKGAPKGPPAGERPAPRPAPPAERPAPPVERPAPPAAAPARPAPEAAPPPRPAPPAAAPARPAPEAAPPPRPTPPAAPPAARPTPPAAPAPSAAPAAPTPPATARPERREAPAGAERERREAPGREAPAATTPGGAERREPGARPATPPPAAQTPPAAAPSAPAPSAPAPSARQAPAAVTPPAATPPAPTPPTPPAAAPTPPPAGAAPPPAGRTPGEGRDGRRQGGPGAAGGPGAPPAPGTPGAPPAPGAAPGTPPNAAAPGAPPNAAVAPVVVAPGGANVKVVQPQAPQVVAPIPAAPPPAAALAPIAPGAQAPGPRRMDDFRGQRTERQEGGRTVYTEPGRIIVQDPSGQSYIRHNEVDRFRYGARDIRTDRVGGDNRTIVVRPDGSEIITVVDGDGQLLRRIRRDRDGRELIIIDNSYRPRGGPGGPGGFYVDLPPPVIRIPQNRYVVDYEDASPDLVYDTLIAPPVERIDRRYTLDEIRYSPMVRQRMPSIDLDTINFATGSWDIPADQASKLQVIADGLNRAIQRNPRAVFLIEGHTDAVGADVDNLSLSDRRAESAAELLTQQFQVPAENLTSQGYGEQYLKIQTDGPERQNRRVTIRNITPLLNGGQASLPPPPAGTAPPR